MHPAIITTGQKSILITEITKLSRDKTNKMAIARRMNTTSFIVGFNWLYCFTPLLRIPTL